MEKYFDDILRGIQRKSSEKSNWDEQDFYREIVRGYFIPEMGYERKDLSIQEYANTFCISGILIRGSVEERVERLWGPFIRQVEKSGCKWGILIHTDGIWLMNSDIVPNRNSESSFTNSQIALEIRYGMNTDQKYFMYFSAENTIGEKKNACFFRDITNYKNNEYKGTEKSWPSYESALKRFLDFYVENKGDY